MTNETKRAVEEYQCPGCVCGSDISCYEKDHDGIGCSKHVAGTTRMPHVGRIFLGLPKGFSRLGQAEKTVVSIFAKLEGGWYDKLNVPAWKFLDKKGNTLVRGISPRINMPWIHIFLGDHISDIGCLEITQEDIDEMD